MKGEVCMELVSPLTFASEDSQRLGAIVLPALLEGKSSRHFNRKIGMHRVVLTRLPSRSVALQEIDATIRLHLHPGLLILREVSDRKGLSPRRFLHGFPPSAWDQIVNPFKPGVNSIGHSGA